MIKLFRRIRQRLLTENKFSKYLIYALGEIILVVIGILIALSINNWNQERSQHDRLQNIYRTVQDNLTTDTVNVTRVIRFHEKIDELIDEQLSGGLTDELIDTLNAENFRQCQICSALNSSYESFVPQKKGMSLLQNFVDNNESGSAEISSKIIEFYANYVPTLEDDLDRLEDIIMENLKEFEKQEWYVDIVYGKFSSEAMHYFQNDLTYRNSTVSYKMVSTHNNLRNIKDYKEEALLILEELEAHLSQKE